MVTARNTTLFMLSDRVFNNALEATCVDRAGIFTFTQIGLHNLLSPAHRGPSILSLTYNMEVTSMDHSDLAEDSIDAG